MGTINVSSSVLNDRIFKLSVRGDKVHSNTGVLVTLWGSGTSLSSAIIALSFMEFTRLP
jgi:hypothetical protein